MKIKRPVLILWLLYAGFIIYGSLIPFDLSLERIGQGLQFDKINIIPFFNDGISGCRMDIVSNFLLFLIYGILFHSAFVRPGRRQPWIFPACVLSGLFLSITVENLQFLSPSRVGSVTDVIAHSIAIPTGCILSMILQGLYREKAIRWVRFMLDTRPVLFVLLIYALIIFLDFLVPFNISIQVSDIAHSIKNINSIPFAGIMSIRQYFAAAGADLVIFMILGFLINICLINYTRLKGFRAMILTVALTALFSATVEIAQIFFISRVTDITDVITAVFGAILGIVASKLIKRPGLLILLYTGFIFSLGLSPFLFKALPVAISVNNMIPFYAYWYHTTIFTIDDLAGAAALYLPLGFLIALKTRARKLTPYYCLCGATLAFLIEFCQLYIPGRYFDITDVLLSGIGAHFGALAYINFSKRSLPINQEVKQ